jgi:toxin YoeB
MRVTFSDEGWEDYLYWATDDASALTKINSLIENCRRTPFIGLGKPEPLRGDLSGWWARRITQEHRLIYRVTGKGETQALEIIACRFHYLR